MENPMSLFAFARFLLSGPSVSQFGGNPKPMACSGAVGAGNYVKSSDS